ncbi:hypothetical protein NKI17_25675 [Mesorhizobium sp. M0816]
MREDSCQTAVSAAGKEFIGRRPASPVVIVIVQDHDASWAQHLEGSLKTELDRIVPIAIEMGQRYSGFRIKIYRVFEQALMKDDPFAIDRDAKTREAGTHLIE